MEGSTCPADGISGSTAAAPSPTSSAATRTARCIRTKLLSENPGGLSRRRHPGHPRPARRRRRRADPGRPHRRGQDGHDRRHQRAARAQGRPRPAAHHPRLPRRAAHRLPGAARHLRQGDRPARAALRARRRGRRARARRRHGRARCPISTQCSRATRQAQRDDGIDAVAIVFMHAWKYPDARAGGRKPLPRDAALRRSRSATRSRRWSSWSAAATPPWSTPICRRSCRAMCSRWRTNWASRRLDCPPDEDRPNRTPA